MKLLTKNTIYFFFSLIFVMIAGGIVLYFTIRTIVYRQTDDNLKTEAAIIEDQILQTNSIPDFAATFGHQIEVRLLNTQIIKKLTLKDTSILDDKSGDYLAYRSIYYSGNTKEKKGYTISIYQTLGKKQELLEDISLYMSFLFLSLLVISIIINYLISKRLWKPFYASVDQAANFDILSGQPVLLPETDIVEFRQLNNVIEQMTRKMRANYLNLKEFNENAAHEIQTPLAIIRSKTDILVQKTKLKKESLDLIKSINEATTKLFKLNQGLLLISKIDNQYFHDEKEISLRQVVEICLDNYREIMEIKGIRVEIKAPNPANVRMNEVLADVLISNLLSNAVRYNIDKGFIKCEINDRYISITNTGMALKADPQSLFRRFHKGTDHAQSVGLGLSIVKKIADNYKMKISYTFKDDLHQLKLDYQQEVSQST